MPRVHRVAHAVADRAAKLHGGQLLILVTILTGLGYGLLAIMGDFIWNPSQRAYGQQYPEGKFLFETAAWFALGIALIVCSYLIGKNWVRVRRGRPASVALLFALWVPAVVGTWAWRSFDSTSNSLAAISAAPPFTLLDTIHPTRDEQRQAYSSVAGVYLLWTLASGVLAVVAIWTWFSLRRRSTEATAPAMPADPAGEGEKTSVRGFAMPYGDRQSNGWYVTTRQLAIGAGSLALLGLVLFIGLRAKNECPAALRGVASTVEGSIQWGGTTPIVTAELGSVTAECIQVGASANAARGASGVTYDIPATASVRYVIRDEKAYALRPDLKAPIQFEAVSESGTVLSSAKGSLTIVTGNNSGEVSARITGMGPEEVRRVKEVRAKWLYGVQ